MYRMLHICFDCMQCMTCVTDFVKYLKFLLRFDVNQIIYSAWIASKKNLFAGHAKASSRRNPTEAIWSSTRRIYFFTHCLSEAAMDSTMIRGHILPEWGCHGLYSDKRSHTAWVRLPWTLQWWDVTHCLREAAMDSTVMRGHTLPQ